MRFNYKKKYGQNFLQNDKVIHNIVNNLGANEDDLVIEIGPGAGALTKILKNKGYQLLCYEIDLEVKEYLDKLEGDRLELIYDDFLNRDILKDIENKKYDNIYIIGNLPYYITTPIITKIINDQVQPKEMIFMVQKEVADRFSAKPFTREYGSISVFLNYYFDIKKLFIVPKRDFYPIPNVDSAVIKFTSKDVRIDVDIEKFNKIVRDSFQFKRKNLRNNLKIYDQNRITNILKEYGLSLDNRAEELSYEVFVAIANKY